MTPRYEELAAPAELVAHVHCVWSFEFDEAGVEQAVPPDGRSELIVNLGTPYEELGGDGRWTVQLAWKAGRSDLTAHFRFTPGAHGGTVSAVDDGASELIDPNFARPLRPLAPVAELEYDEPESEPELPIETFEAPEPPPAPKPRARKGKPAVPAWEDVLLGVRSSGQR